MKKQILIGLISLLVGFIISLIYFTHKGGGEQNSIVKTDTITITKTDTLWKQTTSTIVKPIPSKIDTIVLKDTIPQELIYEHLTYKGDTVMKDSTKVRYQADITGYNASLDSLTWQITFPQITNSNQTIITNEITKYKKPKISLGVCAATGYGLINKKFDVFVGLSLQVPIYNFYLENKRKRK